MRLICYTGSKQTSVYNIYIVHDGFSFPLPLPPILRPPNLYESIADGETGAVQAAVFRGGYGAAEDRSGRLFPTQGDKGGRALRRLQGLHAGQRIN